MMTIVVDKPSEYCSVRIPSSPGICHPFHILPPRLRSGAGQHRNIVVIGGLKCPYFFLHSDCEFSSTHEKRNSAARKTRGSAICCRCAKAKMAVACTEKCNAVDFAPSQTFAAALPKRDSPTETNLPLSFNDSHNSIQLHPKFSLWPAAESRLP